MDVCVVTGGGSGIGRAVAEAFGKEVVTVITGRSENKLRNVQEEMNAAGYHVEVKACDIAKREEVKALAAYAAGFGRVTKVVNCAGVSGTMADPETIIRINCLGTVYINQEFFRVMDGGCIVDISSQGGYMLPGLMTPSDKVYSLILEDEEAFVRKCTKKAMVMRKPELNGHMAYMLSKNFVRWYAKKCAYKYAAEKGLRVVSVSPGFVKTEMTDKEPVEASAIVLSYSGLNRPCRPEEMAFLIASIADERCGYLSGVDILCDAGCMANGYGMMTATKKYDGHGRKEKW